MTATKTYAFLFLILFTFVFHGCEEPTDWELTAGNNGQLVVEAILTNELISQTVRLSQSYDQINGHPPAVTDASVQVTVNGFTVNFIADTADPGLYVSEFPFPVVNDLVYYLNIDWQEKQYTASSELSDVSPIPPITFRPFGNDGLLVFGDFVPLYNPNQQAMYEVDVIWSHLTNDSTARANMLFYTFNSVEVNELAQPNREIVPFPIGSIVIARKFGLNDDFADYLRALFMETDLNSGTFYLNPASLPTNISNGGLGFFSTCSVLTRVVFAL